MTTIETLLNRLSADQDEHSWREFYAYYRLFILSYAMRKGLKWSEAEDVLQETMISMMKAFRTGFQYDPTKGRFRGYLKVVTSRRVTDALRRLGRHPVVYVEDPEVLAKPEEEELEQDLDWMRAMLDQAMINLAETNRFSEINLRAFKLYWIKGLSGENTAAMCGMTANNVYQITSRVKVALVREVAKMNGASE